MVPTKDSNIIIKKEGNDREVEVPPIILTIEWWIWHLIMWEVELEKKKANTTQRESTIE
jgi:hypothetical protein